LQKSNVYFLFELIDETLNLRKKIQNNKMDKIVEITKEVNDLKVS